MVRLNVRVKSEIYKDFTREAETEGRSVSDVIRVLMRQYIQAKKAEREFQAQLTPRGKS